MLDEFGVNVEDDSEEEVAAGILRLRRCYCSAGLEEEEGKDGEEEGGLRGEVRGLEERWTRRGEMKVGMVDGGDVEVEGEWDDLEEDEDEEGGGKGDVEMMDSVPEVVPPAREKVKVEPEVDEEGFTKVVGKKNRR